MIFGHNWPALRRFSLHQVAEAYPVHDAIRVRSIRRCAGRQPGVRIVFHSPLAPDNEFLYSIGGGRFAPSADLEGAFVHLFNPEFAGADPTVVAVAVPGSDPDPRVLLTFHLTCSATGAIALTPVDAYLKVYAGEPEDESRPLPTAEEIDFARRTWGDLLDGIDGDYERARILNIAQARELLAARDDYLRQQANGDVVGGILDYGTIPAFELYRRMMTGGHDGFCSHWSLIFTLSCRCFDIPARPVHLEKVIVAGEEPHAETPPIGIGSLHATTEIFDRARNQWIWLDNRFRTLGAYLGDEGPLNLAEMHLFASQEHRRARLFFDIFDPETGHVRRLPLAETRIADYAGYCGFGAEYFPGLA